MQKTIMVVLALTILVAVPIDAQEIKATTEDGSVVVLSKDGTWKFVESEPGAVEFEEALAPDVVERESKANCAKHGTDFFIRNGCETLQKESAAKLSQGKPADVSDSDWAAIRRQCFDRHGTDYFIWYGCEQLQVELLRKLK